MQRQNPREDQFGQFVFLLLRCTFGRYTYFLASASIFMSISSMVIIMFLSGMDVVGCHFCRQPLEICGRRSNRRAVSFEVQMMQGFENGMVSALSCIFPLH
jgi:hypothetical protein